MQKWKNTMEKFCQGLVSPDDNDEIIDLLAQFLLWYCYPWKSEISLEFRTHERELKEGRVGHANTEGK